MNGHRQYDSSHITENPSLPLWLGIQEIVGKPIMQFPPNPKEGQANFYMATHTDEKQWKRNDRELLLVGLTLAEILVFLQFSDPYNEKGNTFFLSNAQVVCELDSAIEFPIRQKLGLGIDASHEFTYEQLFTHSVQRPDMLMLGINHLSKFLAEHYQIDWRIDESFGQCHCLEHNQSVRTYRSDIYLEPKMEQLLHRLDVLMGQQLPCVNRTGYYGHIDQQLMECSDDELGEVMEKFGLQLKVREIKFPRLIIFPAVEQKR